MMWTMADPATTPGPTRPPTAQKASQPRIRFGFDSVVVRLGIIFVAGVAAALGALTLGLVWPGGPGRQVFSLIAPEDAAAMGRIIPSLSKAIMQATGALSWNLLQNNGGAAGQVVGHVHLHIIPRPAGDSRDEPIKGNGLPFNWPAGEVDHAVAGKLADRIKTFITGR